MNFAARATLTVGVCALAPFAIERGYDAWRNAHAGGLYGAHVLGSCGNATLIGSGNATFGPVRCSHGSPTPIRNTPSPTPTTAAKATIAATTEAVPCLTRDVPTIVVAEYPIDDVEFACPTRVEWKTFPDGRRARINIARTTSLHPALRPGQHVTYEIGPR